MQANSCSSPMSPVVSGVPQGTVLGPLLFLIYINDLPTNISSNVRLFADDCVIYRSINSDQDVYMLQSDLTLITAWCEKWLMTLNVNKTSLISFHRRQQYPLHNYFLNGSVVSSVSSYKYLGITFSHNLSWSAHITHVTNEANRVLGYLRRTLRLAPIPVKILAYLTLVRPKLEYACAVWDPHHINLSKFIESVQNRAARFIFNDYSYHTSVTELKSRANLPNLETRRKIARLCLYHKLYHSSLDNSVITHAHRRSCRISHPKAVYPPHAHTSAHLHSFFIQTAIDWNDLPIDAAHHSNATHFKSAIERINLRED